MYSGFRLLIVVPDFPYPPNHGGRVDIWGRIITFYQLGFHIDLIVTIKEEPKTDEIEVVKQYVKNIWFCKRKNRIVDMFSVYPLQIKSRDSLRNLKLGSEYDLVVLESEYVCSILNNPSLKSKQIVLRVHNNETTYYRELGDSVKFSLRKFYYYLESIKFFIVNDLYKKKITNRMFISEDEFQGFNSRNRITKNIFLPPPVNLDDMKKQDLNSNKVLFIGSLFMVNNQEAIKWFVQKVHPLLLNINNYQLIIAGNSKGYSIDWMNDFTKYDNIKIYNSPDNLDQLYRECSVFVNPMLHGAGIKLKTIDAIQNGLPVVSTKIGNQGTGLVNGRDIFVNDSPEKFAENIIELLNDRGKRKQLVNSAQSFLLKNYNQKLILEMYLNNLFERA